MWAKALYEAMKNNLVFGQSVFRWVTAGRNSCPLTRAAALDELQLLLDEHPGMHLIDVLRDAVDDGYKTLEHGIVGVRVKVKTDNDLLARLRNLRTRMGDVKVGVLSIEETNLSRAVSEKTGFPERLAREAERCDPRECDPDCPGPQV